MNFNFGKKEKEVSGTLILRLTIEGMPHITTWGKI